MTVIVSGRPIEPIWLRYRGGRAGIRPTFLANLVFSYLFGDTKAADMAFASNLLGAVVGGALEYVALISGYGWLLVVVGGLYALGWLFASRLRWLADRNLDLETQALPGQDLLVERQVIPGSGQ